MLWASPHLLFPLCPPPISAPHGFVFLAHCCQVNLNKEGRDEACVIFEDMHMETGNSQQRLTAPLCSQQGMLIQVCGSQDLGEREGKGRMKEFSFYLKIRLFTLKS